MPSEQVLREEAALVARATRTDSILKRIGAVSEWPRAFFIAAAIVLDRALARYVAEDLMEEYVCGSSVKEIVRYIRTEVKEEMGQVPEGFGEVLRKMVRVKAEGTPKAKGRTPKMKDWKSNLETRWSRYPIYPRKWDKGGSGPFWTGTPKIVVWRGGQRGEWLQLNSELWAYLIKRGFSGEEIATWSRKWIKEGDVVRPGNIGWLEKTGSLKAAVRRALTEDEEEGSEELDVLSRIPYKGFRDGVHYAQIVLNPGMGNWSEEGKAFWKAMHSKRIPVGISIPILDDQPQPTGDPCDLCDVSLNADETCPLRRCKRRVKQTPRPKSRGVGLVALWAQYNALRAAALAQGPR